MALPTVERLRELFILTDDGRLVNRVSRGGMALAGMEAGRVDSGGYLQVEIDGKRLMTHRIIYAMATGAWPLQYIDHISGDKTDNRPSNLRDVSASVNMQNQRNANRGSSTGVLGVYPHGGRFRARIVVNGRQRHLGVFATAAEAHEAYVTAKRVFHPGGML